MVRTAATGEVDRAVRVVLRELRCGAGLTLKAAAAAAGWTPQRLRRLEQSSGPLYFDQVLTLAEVYDVSVTDLVKRARNAVDWPAAATGPRGPVSLPNADGSESGAR